MSYDDFTIYYVLTATDWQSVSSPEIDNLPNDWIRLYEVHVSQSSGFGPESRQWTVVKQHPRITDEEADEVERRYRRPGRPSELSEASLRAISGKGDER